MLLSGLSIKYSPSTAKDMIVGRSAWNGRHYAFSVYTALVLLLFYILYVLDNTGLSIHLTYETPQVPNLQVNSKPMLPAFEIKDKVAVIVESRDLSALTPLLVHFSSILGPSWPIVLFTVPTSEIPVSPPFQRLVSSGRLDIRYLPETVKFELRQDVSDFLVQPWLYEQLAPSKHMLFFQADSMLCARSELTVDDFLEYDFIGAPIDENYGHGFNGGLSLRNRTLVLDIVKNYQLEKATHGNQTEGVVFEDQWFYEKIVNMTGVRLPSVEVAQRFAVESIWYDRPLGYHQVQRWQGGQIAQVDAWCPEHRLVTGGMIAG